MAGAGFVKPVVARFDLPDASADGGLMAYHDRLPPARCGLHWRAWTGDPPR